MIDQVPPQEHNPVGYNEWFEQRDTAISIPSSPPDRVRTLSSESLPAVPEVTKWPIQMAYDAYHDADFTLAPIHGVFQPPSSGKYDGLVTRTWQGSSQRLLTRPPMTRRVVKGGVFPSPGGLDYQDFSPEVSFDETGVINCTETFA